MRGLNLTLILLISTLLYGQGTDCVVINYDTHVIFNGKKVVDNLSLELLINSAVGTEYAEISIPYSENNEVKNLEAGIYDIFGNEIRKLKKKNITTRTPWDNSNFHTDNRLLTFKLIHTTYPYIIKYKYSYVTNNYISLTHWSPHFSKKTTVKKASLTVDIPKELNINLFLHNIDSAKITQHEDITRYHWLVKDFNSTKEECFSPQFDELNPYVIIMPEDFHYGVDGKSSTWKEFGNWEAELIDELDELTEQEEKKIIQLTDSIESDTEKIKILYHYLQDNTRYINVSLDIGGLLPHPASYVCTNRYGDCKALSNYMKAMLKFIGIEANYTSIYSGIRPIRVKKNFPSQQANHVILSIPLNKDTIWLECTDKTAPFNYLGASTQNRLALINQKDNSKLVPTPTHQIADALSSFHTTIEIAENVSFISRGKLKGRKYDYFKGFDTSLSAKEKKNYIDYTNFSHKADIQSFNIHRPHRDSAYLFVDLNGEANQLTEKLGSKILLNPFKAIGYELTPKDERENDIFVYYPINKCDTLIYDFQNKITEVSGLKNQEIISEFGQYKRNFKITDNKLIIYRHFQLKQNYYNVEKYNEFYDFVNNSCNTDQQKVIISF